MSELKRRWGRNIAQAREGRGLSQRQLAAEVGITQQSLSDIERGEFAPKDSLRPVLARVLGTTVAGLFPYEVDPPEAEAS